MSEDGVVHEIDSAETYQLDSDDFDSQGGFEGMKDREYDELVDEGEYDHIISSSLTSAAENGYTEEEIQQMTLELKERGIINFLRSYLKLNEHGETPSLRKLLLGFGFVPLSPVLLFLSDP